MRLSLRAIELCRTKFGKEIFYGFEQMDESVLDGISEDDAKQDFHELTQNGMIDFADGNIHLSALGQHICNMMFKPEQYIVLDNGTNNICVKIYIRNIYYLCVIEDKKVKSDDGYDRYIFELLPNLDLVVGAFVYALHCDEKYGIPNDDNSQVKPDVRIVGKAWNKTRTELSEIIIDGNYYNEDIHYQMIEKIEDFESKTEEIKSEVSELINKLTGWMFEKMSVVYESEAH